MQVKSIAKEHSAILSTFIKLQFVIKIFALSIFEWSFKTGFTVSFYQCCGSDVYQTCCAKSLNQMLIHHTGKCIRPFGGI